MIDKKLHILIWTLFIFYETVLIGWLFGEFGSFGNYAVHYTYNIIIFYVNGIFVMPWVMKKSHEVVWRLPLMVVVQILLFATVVYCLDYLLIHYTGIIDFNLDITFYGRICYRAIFFIGLSCGYYFLATYLKEKDLNQELEKQQLINLIKQKEMENELNITVNAYLKAQINPHFLFNTLNFIYNNTRKTAPQAADAIMTLSDMMRYAIKSEQTGSAIYLKDEIEQMENLIHLHQLRQSHTLYVELQHDEIHTDLKFIPLVLVTLLENVFKHGNLSKKSKPALIQIHIRNGKLYIHTENLVNEHKNNSGEGIGLANVRKRLLHNYGERVEFNYYTDQNKVFHVHILLDLSEL